MKKTLLLITALVASALSFTACNDDDNDAPQVKIYFTYGENVKSVGEDLYIVKGEDFSVESITCTAVRPNSVAIITSPVNYWLDGAPLLSTPFAPFKVEFSTTDLPVGSHRLTVQMGIAEEGYALSMGVTQIGFNVVADAADIPTSSGSESQTHQITYTLQ